MVCELAYRTLDHPTIKEKRVNDIIFQIFGVAIKKHNHGLAFPVRIVQILLQQEITNEPIAYGVLVLMEQYQITKIFEKMLEELIERLNASVNANADNMITKHFSTFLTRFSESSPKLVLPHLSMLGQELLNYDVNTSKTNKKPKKIQLIKIIKL